MKLLLSTIILLISSFDLSAQCYPDRHDTSLDNAWVSCTRQNNPNTLRGNSHWIVYDLGAQYNLGRTHFWNINSPGNTEMGIQEAVIDYSDDFSNWNEWGVFTLEEASSSGFYEGETGPDLSGISARYILITIIENFGNVCSGFAEVKIETNGIVTSTDDVQLYEKLELSPNPAEDFTKLKFTSLYAFESQAQLINNLGAVVKTYNLKFNSGDNSIEIDLGDLSSGNYILRFNQDTKVFSGQLTIIKP